jgi:hypothetical protein
MSVECIALAVHYGLWIVHDACRGKNDSRCFPPGALHCSMQHCHNRAVHLYSIMHGQSCGQILTTSAAIIVSTALSFALILSLFSLPLASLPSCAASAPAARSVSFRTESVSVADATTPQSQCSTVTAGVASELRPFTSTLCCAFSIAAG